MKNTHCISFGSFEYLIVSIFTLLVLFCRLESSIRVLANKTLCEKILILRRGCLPIQKVDETILFNCLSCVL